MDSNIWKNFKGHHCKMTLIKAKGGFWHEDESLEYEF